MKRGSRVRPQEVPCSPPARLVVCWWGAGLRAERTGLCRGALDVTPFDPRRVRGWAGPALYMETPRPGYVT